MISSSGNWNDTIDVWELEYLVYVKPNDTVDDDNEHDDKYVNDVNIEMIVWINKS